MTSPGPLHQVVVESRVASQHAAGRREQTHRLVTARQQCCVQSRRAIADPHQAPLSGPASCDTATP